MVMKRVFLVFSFCLFCCFTSRAQSGIRDNVSGIIGRYHKKDSVRVKVAKPVGDRGKSPGGLRNNRVKKTKVSSPVKVLRDTLYCLSTKRQHGWFDALVEVDYKTARLNPSYVMLTDKSAHGHWTKMKVMNNYGELEGGQLSTYLIDLDNVEVDSTVNRVWAERLEDVCQYEFVEDPVTGDMVQERAYDENMNIVYTFSRVKVGDRKFVGSYRDAQGLPAEMRSDSLYTYGTLIAITEDVWGNDSVLEYVDAKGVKKRNSDGAGMSVHVYDEYGCELRFMSCDHDGNRMLDAWGNCGMECTYDRKHRLLTSVSMDAQWCPVPIRGRERGLLRGGVKMERVYDKYGRVIELLFITPKDEPGVTDRGVHKKVFSYDDFGNLVEESFYDVEGRLVPVDESGIAVVRCVYDSGGRYVGIQFLNKNRELINVSTVL